jgi:predicted Ser/Thr protein kinase
LYQLFSLKSDEDWRYEPALVGQGGVQRELFRVLNNLVSEGRPNRLILLHGPSGSGKTTAVACILRALEHYSASDEGALYRFHWVFPNQDVLRGTIGFGGRQSGSLETTSYAKLPEHQLDARLVIGQRDHPLFLLPARRRAKLLERAYEAAGAACQASTWIRHGSLCHQNRLIYEGLLNSYDGSLEQVLRHVQVERYFISRRYRVGAVSLGPQLSVDAAERQLTADRSLGALPASLQALTLFEAFGELVDAGGGVIEFSDLLKRPLEAFKYLQTSVESGEASLGSQNIQLNCVMVGSANEEQLAAFREHPEFRSFRGRLALVRVPYLLKWTEENSIYDAQVASQMRRHVAPHATEMAARFAVMTRLRRPEGHRYEGRLAQVVSSLGVMEKCEFYATLEVPSRIDEECAALLRGAREQLLGEFSLGTDYEGSSGASPREMRTVLLDAGQSQRYACLSPFAVLDEIEALCKRQNEYSWVRPAGDPGGYHDHEVFRAELRRVLLDEIEDEFRVASGLIDDRQYVALFERYITNVSYWVKGEKKRNPLTGEPEPPDEGLMNEVEALVGVDDNIHQFRHGILGRIAARAIDQPDHPIDATLVFSAEIARMREAAFADRRHLLGRVCHDLWVLLEEGGAGLQEPRRKQATETLVRLRELGYDDHCAADAARVLSRERFAEVVV